MQHTTLAVLRGARLQATRIAHPRSNTPRRAQNGVLPLELARDDAMRAALRAGAAARTTGGGGARGGASLAPAAPAAAPCDGPFVMISYRVPESGAGGDGAVFRLADALHARGYRAFVGESGIQGGDCWPTVIQDAVKRCAAFVILCSPTYGFGEVSPWTARELGLAAKLNKPLLAVWHSGPWPPPAIEIYLVNTQYIPNRGDLRDGYVAAGVPLDDVADELAGALARLGIKPAGAATRQER